MAQVNDWLTDDGLNTLKTWAKQGKTNQKIADEIGISTTTLRNWCKKHEDIENAIEQGRTVIIGKLYDALIKKALGYTYNEMQIKTLPNGEQEQIVKNRHVPPDIGAIHLLLKNWDPEHWKNDPANYEIKKDLLELQKRLAEDKLF